MPQKYKLEGVELFAPGHWNGKDWSESVVDAIVESSRKLAGMEPPFKLSHDPKQEMAGQPAIGWLHNVRKVGKKLISDIKDVPEVIFNLIDRKAYKKISAEIWQNFTDETKNKHPFVLSGAALLGADVPALYSITDVAKLFGLSADPEGLKHVFNFAVDDGAIIGELGSIPARYPGGISDEAIRNFLASLQKEHDDMADETKLKEREATLQAQQDQLEADRKTFAAERAKLEQEKADRDKALLEAAKKTRLQAAHQFASDHCNEKLMSFLPRDRDRVEFIHNALSELSAQEGVRTFSAADGTTLSPLKVFEEFINSQKACQAMFRTFSAQTDAGEKPDPAIAIADRMKKLHAEHPEWNDSRIINFIRETDPKLIAAYEGGGS
jgi:hypothetical protein